MTYPIDRIALEPDPDVRVRTLQVMARRALSSHSASAAEEFPLLRALEVTTETVRDARRRLMTAEAARLHWTGLEPLLRMLEKLVFLRCGHGGAGLDADGLFLRHIARAEDQGELWQILETNGRLLGLSVDWAMGRYEAVPLSRALQGLTPADRQRFLDLKDRLSSSLMSEIEAGESAGARSARDLVRRPSATTSAAAQAGIGRPGEIRAILGELRSLRAKGQMALRSDLPPKWVEDEGVGDPPPGHVQIFTLNLGDDRSPQIAGIARGGGAYHLWYSEAWSRLGHEARLMREVPSGRDEEESERKLDSLHARYAGHPHMDLARILAEPESRPEISHFDLTRTLPLGWICDPEAHYVISLATGRRAPRPSGPARGVEFWGRMDLGLGSPLRVDDGGRRLEIASESALAWHYPDPLPRDDGSLPDADWDGVWALLPYASYERWMLDDVCLENGVPFRAISDQEGTRASFLGRDWGRCSVLHVATHGLGHPDDEERSGLRFARGRDGRDLVTFLDVLSIDWSGLDLVFLNACSSGFGRPQPGGAELSMAWGFKAGGAKAVIANRWPVDDEVAWCFAKRFYERWQLGTRGDSVAEAFRSALREIQRQPRFSRPATWGSFLLIQ